MSAVEPRFPEAKYTAVGAFIFLRFFCPAIVAPDVEGLVSTAPSREMRRGLLLVAKVIQNLANNVLFGVKEPYMFSLNEFLVHNVFDITRFLHEISVSTCFWARIPFPLFTFYLTFSRFPQIALITDRQQIFLTSARVWHCIAFFTIIGIMFAKLLYPEKDESMCGLLESSLVDGPPF